MNEKEGQKHGETVVDGCVGAVMQKLLEIQKYSLPTYQPTNLPTDTTRCRFACP